MDPLLLELESTPVLNARRELLGGREYVVANAVILKHGVLPGSKGPLYYPLNEVTADQGIWNGIPVTARHPFVTKPDGTPLHVSARRPDIHNAFVVGMLFNDRVDGDKRSLEVWFDVQNANRIDPRIVPAVLAGKEINGSTGLNFRGLDQAVANSKFGDKAYTHSVRGIQPDHFAILMDEKGACSVQDGCGINVNSLTNPDPEHTIPLFPEVHNVDKAALVSWLTVNCDCWKGPKASETLNALDETVLKGLKSNSESSKSLTLTVNALKEIGVAVKAPTDAKVGDLVTLVKNATSMPKDDDEYETASDGTKTKKKKPPTTNSEPMTKDSILNALKASPLTREEYLLIAPTGVTETLNAAQTVVDQKRIEIINTLTKQFTNADERKAKILKLKDKKLSELTDMLEFASVTNTAPASKTADEQFLMNFFGQTGAPADTSRPVVNQKDVLAPSLEYDFLNDAA